MKTYTVFMKVDWEYIMPCWDFDTIEEASNYMRGFVPWSVEVRKHETT